VLIPKAASRQKKQAQRSDSSLKVLSLDFAAARLVFAWLASPTS